MNEDYDVNVLYKYRNVSSENLVHVERIFTHDELYFSKPADFNDPFDSKPIFSFRASKSAIRKFAKEKTKRHLKHLSRSRRRLEIKKIVKSDILKSQKIAKNLENHHRERIIEKTGVFCLSEVPDHILMWSHYANSHTGICLEFEATSSTPFFGLAQRVKYQKEYPTINLIKDSPDDILQAALLTKAIFWEYEKEWRITWQDAPPGVYKYPHGLLKGVILGVKISDEHRMLVHKWIDKMDYRPAIYQAKLKQGQYGLNITPLT